MYQLRREFPCGENSAACYIVIKNNVSRAKEKLIEFDPVFECALVSISSAWNFRVSSEDLVKLEFYLGGTLKTKELRGVTLSSLLSLLLPVRASIKPGYSN